MERVPLAGPIRTVTAEELEAMSTRSAVLTTWTDNRTSCRRVRVPRVPRLRVPRERRASGEPKRRHRPYVPRPPEKRIPRRPHVPWQRNCPNCGVLIVYNSGGAFINARKREAECKPCSYDGRSRGIKAYAGADRAPKAGRLASMAGWADEYSRASIKNNCGDSCDEGPHCSGCWKCCVR